jgi:hypothetical protein
MKYVENNNELFTKYPVILVNLYLIKLHTTLNEKYFSILKRLHKKHFDEFDKSTQHNYYIMMSNFCLSRIWNGFGEYYNEKFELDNDFLKTELYKSFDVYFHPTTFINIGLYALKLKKIRWVKEFINNYGKEVFPEFRDFASSYLQAEIFFTESDNNAALEAIARLQPATPAHKQFIRDLTLKIYYETDNSEPAEYLISSGLHHIRHNENLVDERRKSEGNFLLYLQKLIKLKETNDKFKINLMKNDLAKKMDIVNKDWLMEKVNEL